MAPKPIIYKGSEWVKCDLHLHTPDTKLANQYEGATADEKWQSFFDTIAGTSLSVIGVTDYFAIGGYEKMLQAKVDGKLPNIKLILPNIEFRLDRKNEDGDFINIHVLFADERIVPVQKIKDFLTRLAIFPTDNQQNMLHCTDDDIRSAGGYEKIAVEKSALEEALKGFTPLRDYIIIGVPGGYGGFRSSDAGRGTRIAIEFDKYCHAFFGNNGDRTFFLSDRGAGVGEPKPVISASDAHKLADVGSKYTWIKSDATFEGVVQMIYEPDIRVSLEKNEPVYLYPQIISVELLNSGNHGDAQDKDRCPLFHLDKPIAFSPNLTSIIGARATGKSILAEAISFVFDEHQKESRGRDGDLPFIEFLANDYPDIEIKVVYSMGGEVHEVTRAVGEINDPFYSPPFRIEYWPQGKIEDVATSQEKIAAYLDQMLVSPVIQELEETILDGKEKLGIFRLQYLTKFDLKLQIRDLVVSQKEIEGYLAKLNDPECKTIIKDITIEKQKLEKIADFVKGIDEMTEALEAITEEFSFLDFPEKAEVSTLFADEEVMIAHTDKLYELKETGFAKQFDELKQIKIDIENSATKKAIEARKKELEDGLLEYAKENKIKITKQEYESRSKMLVDVKRRLKELEIEVKKADAAKEKHEELSAVVSEKVKEWQVENERLIDEFNQKFRSGNIVANWDDPENYLSAWIAEQFMASSSYFTKKYQKEFKIKSPIKSNNVEELVEEMHGSLGLSTEAIIYLLENNQKPDLQTSSGKEETVEWFFAREETAILREDLILRLKSRAELGTREVTYKGKTLGKQRMSFGERCGTMLEIIVGSDGHPIILDQPEDHLDSGLLVSRIIPLIREQKMNRQIIICTHSANIVVLGDSDLVNAFISEANPYCEKGSLENPNTVSSILQVLEGGKDALRKRSKRVHT